MSWPFPLSERGDPLTHPLPLIAPGVRGYTMRVRGWYYVPLIEAERPGQGDVKRFLDSLPRDESIRVPVVISPILAGALERRGFVRTKDYDRATGQWVPVFERRRQSPPGR